MLRGIGRLRAGGNSLEAAIRALYAGGAQGAWFDPSDWSTLYQDAAGTTAVTAVGQPVGLILDKSQGQALGAEKVTVSFASATGWTFGAIGTGSAASISGGALQLPDVDASNYGYGGFAVPLTVGQSYELLFNTGAGGTVQVRVGGSANNASVGAWTVAANTTGARVIFTATVANQWITFNGANAAGGTATVASASCKSLAGNHASQSTTTSRPLLQQDAAGYYYLSFDGVDDNLATAAINFTTTQQATVFAGVRKNSDAAAGEVACLYNGGTSGTFGLLAPGGASSASYAVQMSATATNTGRATTYTAPDSRVLTGAVDLSQSAQASQLSLRVNGAAQTLTLSGAAATTQSGFVNQPLGIGFSVGGTNYFNGRIYGLVVVGAAQSASAIAQAEHFMGSRMGIAL